MAKNTTNGKAFEYACLSAILSERDNQNIQVQQSAAYNTTKKKFDSLSKAQQETYKKAAKTAAKQLFLLEPRLMDTSVALELAINADSAAQGVDGDVRDVLCRQLKDEKVIWEIGISCKHNSDAVKHPRITSDKDFGKNWVGIPNSTFFLNKMEPIINKIQQLKDDGKLWKDLTDVEKKNGIYVPILEAYKDEIIRMCRKNSIVSSKLVSYFFGSKDFYKVIMREGEKTTTIEAFNMHNTLGQKLGSRKPITKVPVINLPTRLIEADFKRNKGKKSNTTLDLIFDEGWELTMRLHNKDEKIKPTALAWAVNLKGYPANQTYHNIMPWELYD